MNLLRILIILLIFISCGQIESNKSPVTDKNDSDHSTTLKVDAKEITTKPESEKIDWNDLFQKESAFRNISERFADTNLIPKEFKDFSVAFYTDSKFQEEHIDFKKLTGVIAQCENSIVLNQDNWKFDAWNYIEYLGINETQENTFHYSENQIFFEYRIKEVGTIRTLGFEKTNGSWYLTLYRRNDC